MNLELRTVSFKSSLDGSMQGTWFSPPPSAAVPAPLLVVLHTWSFGMDYSEPRGSYFPMAVDRGWAFLAPDFRGPNRRPEACGSDLAVQDVLDAVAWAKANARIDDDRVFVAGASGGGHMALLLAGRAPELWAGVYAACPIFDIADWHRQRAPKGGKKSQYAVDIEMSCGGLPEERPEEYARRSPRTFIAAARAAETHVDICTGIHDGHSGSVPVSHAIEAFNALADAGDAIGAEDIARIVEDEAIPPHLAFAGSDPFFAGKPVLLRRESANARLTIFEAGHAGNYAACVDWFSRQRRGAPVDWTVGAPAQAVDSGAADAVPR